MFLGCTSQLASSDFKSLLPNHSRMHLPKRISGYETEPALCKTKPYMRITFAAEEGCEFEECLPRVLLHFRWLHIKPRKRECGLCAPLHVSNALQ